SSTRAPSGAGAPAATEAMRPPSIVTVTSSTGFAPVPSTRRAPTSARGSAATLGDPAAVGGQSMTGDGEGAIRRQPERGLGDLGEVGLTSLLEQVFAARRDVVVLVGRIRGAGDHLPVRVSRARRSPLDAAVGHLRGADAVDVDRVRAELDRKRLHVADDA